MASGDARAQVPAELDGGGLRIGRVRSRWVSDIVDRLCTGVERGLLHLGIPFDDIVMETVPGSFEIPMACRILARSGEVYAIVAICPVIPGPTTQHHLVPEGAPNRLHHSPLSTGLPSPPRLTRLAPLHQAH